MKTRSILALGLGLTLASGLSYAQSNDDQNTSPADNVTKPLGNATQSGADKASQSGNRAGDRSTGSTSGSPLGASGSNPAQQNLSFGVLDVNTDGKLSQDEVKGNASLTTDFSKLDTDRNGSLSNSEFAAFESKASGSGGSKPKGKDTNRSSAGEKASDKAKSGADKAEQEIDETRD